MKLYIPILTIILSVFSIGAKAQIDSSLLKPTETQVKSPKLNMDAVYNRPFLTLNKLPVSLGGYLEANWQHVGEAGVSEGHQFQARRLSLFLASSISRNIKFLSEIEFEDGGKEIGIEFAALDMEFHPLFNLRGGIVLNPIGAFNQNHDGPKWEFTDRPIASTQMLPATFSNAGFGVYGKKYFANWMMGYEFYLTGGFDNSIIDNDEGRTSLTAAKSNLERFEESASGEPMYTGKLALKHNNIGELGLSYMGGVYNRWQDDGIVLDEKRMVQVFAIDMNSQLPQLKTNIVGEWAWVMVDVPNSYTQQYGNKQKGGFIDIIQPVLKRRIGPWDNASFNIAIRAEYVDWNVGKFKETNENIGENLWSIMPALSFRPNGQTVLRFNYRMQRQVDFVGNSPVPLSGFNLGISSYF